MYPSLKEQPTPMPAQAVPPPWAKSYNDPSTGANENPPKSEAAQPPPQVPVIWSKPNVTNDAQVPLQTENPIFGRGNISPHTSPSESRRSAPTESVVSATKDEIVIRAKLNGQSRFWIEFPLRGSERTYRNLLMKCVFLHLELQFSSTFF